MVTRTKEFTTGEMRCYIVVQREQSSPDGSGGSDVRWVQHAAFYADVRAKSERENYNDGSIGRIRSEEVRLFTTWWRTDVLTTDRFFFEGRYWNIRGVDNVQNRNKYVSYTAEAGVEQ